jgi:hypothetical protein
MMEDTRFHVENALDFKGAQRRSQAGCARVGKDVLLRGGRFCMEKAPMKLELSHIQQVLDE